MTTDIYPVSGRSRASGTGPIRKAFAAAWRGVFVRQTLGSVVRGPDPAAGWKGLMDRISFAAILLLALGLWVAPYVTGNSDHAASATVSAKSILSPQVLPGNRPGNMPPVRYDNPKVVRGM